MHIAHVVQLGNSNGNIMLLHRTYYIRVVWINCSFLTHFRGVSSGAEGVINSNSKVFLWGYNFTLDSRISKCILAPIGLFKYWLVVCHLPSPL